MVALVMEELRKAFKEKFPDTSEMFDDEDVQRFLDDDHIANAFVEANDGNVTAALLQTEKSMVFRREMQLNSLSEASFPLELLQKGSVYYHNHDRNGNKILYFRIRDSRREPAVVAVVKQYVAHLIDVEHRRDPKQQLVLLFDMSGAGLANFDADLVRFIITCFDTYFPRFLAYLLVFDMPFILNAAWKLIRNWLSERAREKVKFVKRSSVGDYIASDQLWVHMGGTDDFQFVYEPPPDDERPGRARSPSSASAGAAPRSVSGAGAPAGLPSGPLQEVSTGPPLSRSLSGGRRPAPLALAPSDRLLFGADGDCPGLELRNCLGQPVAFKVNTTCPDAFRVRPSAGLLSPRDAAHVQVALKGADLGAVAAARFQVLALAVPADSSRDAALAALRAARREELCEHRLNCGLHLPDDDPEPTLRGLRDEVRAVQQQQQAVAADVAKVRELLRFLVAAAAAVVLLELLRLLSASPARGRSGL